MPICRRVFFLPGLAGNDVTVPAIRHFQPIQSRARTVGAACDASLITAFRLSLQAAAASRSRGSFRASVAENRSGLSRPFQAQARGGPGRAIGPASAGTAGRREERTGCSPNFPLKAACRGLEVGRPPVDNLSVRCPTAPQTEPAAPGAWRSVQSRSLWGQQVAHGLSSMRPSHQPIANQLEPVGPPRVRMSRPGWPAHPAWHRLPLLPRRASRGRRLPLWGSSAHAPAEHAVDALQPSSKRSSCTVLA